jgi:outer membrane receptor protein involved in Fe transport
MRFKLNPIQAAILTCLIPTISYAENTNTELDAVMVTADLREISEQDIPASVDVKTQAELQDQGATHFEDVLLKTPNVNYSGQSSRARHILIRGMGERDEYTGAPNASVGFAIDDIDFSGIGMTANLFDTKQVEVLRGPQNIRYGQSSIAGLINIQTNEPTAYEEGMAELSVGQDNLREFGIVTSGPFNSKEGAPQYRISVFKHGSDGFRTNDTLDQTDTNGRDELNLRAKFRFTPNTDTKIDVTFMHDDLNNGYDAWAADNSFTTLSNDPGKDTQLSNAGSIKVEWQGNPNYVLTSKTSLTNSDMLYSYDDDWSSADLDTYQNEKHQRSYSQELRWASTPKSRIYNNTTDWLVGLYTSNLEAENTTEYYGTVNNVYNMKKLATFGQLDFAMSPKATITAGLRLENDASSFENNLGESYSPEETLWGANLTYSYRYNEKHTAYTGITRGYKAGGFNPDQPSGTASEQLSFDSETLLNYEIGLKSNFSAYQLKTNITAFYMDRINPQFDGNFWDGNWYFYTENLDSAQNYGLEASFDWQATSQLQLFGSLGLLATDVQGTPLHSSFEIDGREQAHAPNYQANLGAKYRSANGFFAESDVTAVDSFYFSNSHAVKSDSYLLVNARIGYETKDYEVYLWAKNLTDEKYATRGFYFDLDYDDIKNEFNRLGDPRQLGITGRVYF